MELASIELNPLGQVEQLAPYLSLLDVGAAVDSFAHFADQLALTERLSDSRLPRTKGQGHPTYCTAGSQLSSGASSPSSNGGSPCWWSSGASLATSDGSGPASVASSCEGGRPRGRRRQNNASAAKNYRRKVKGRAVSLAEELELERRRNSQLRGQLGAKLALYREFVSLLAENMHSQDRQLAAMGARSLAAVLGGTSAPKLSELDSELCYELELQLDKFERILAQ